MLKGTYVVCGKIKTQFVKSGGSLLNTTVNKLPFEMHFPGLQVITLPDPVQNFIRG